MSQSNDSGLNLDHLEAERGAFEAAFPDQMTDRNMPDKSYNSPFLHPAWQGWKARATLANQPAPTDCQAAHADMVKRNALLRERPDLPADRIPAHAELVRLQEENARLRANQPAPTVPAAQTPFMYAILKPNGKPHFDEHCVDDNAEALRAEAQFMSELHGEPFAVVPVYVGAHQPAQEQAEPLSVTQIDRIARNYFSEQWAIQHAKDAIHDAFAESRKVAGAAQQEPVAAPDRKLDPEAMRAIRRAVRYLEENDCTGPAEDLKALLDPLAAAQLDGGQEGSAT